MKRYWKWLAPLLLMALLTPFTPTLDLTISNFFYQQGGGQFTHTPFLEFVYHYGVLPAQCLVIGSALIYLLSFIIPKWKRARPYTLYLILTLAIGSGFVTHALLKDHWGRPRPKQVIAFDGIQPFRPYYSPNFLGQPEPSKSFPCGHCTMGFFFFAIGFIGRRVQNRKLELFGWIVAIILGTMLSYTRIAMGGHFLSDVLVSAVIMWLTALAFDWLIFEAWA